MTDTPYQPRQLQDLSDAEIAPLDALVGAGYPATWYDMASSLYCTFIDLPITGLDLEGKAALSVMLTMCVSDTIGGRMVYWQKGRDVYKSHQNSEIVRLFKGNNHKELAVQFGLTSARIRQILAQERQRRMRQYNQTPAAPINPVPAKSARARRRKKIKRRKPAPVGASQQLSLDF